MVGGAELLTASEAAFAAAKPWSEMWIAVRRTLRLRRKQMSTSLAADLDLLERELMPAELADRLDAYVLAQSSSGLDIADSVDSDLSATLERHSETVEGLGREAAERLDVLSDFVPKLCARWLSQWVEIWARACVGFNGSEAFVAPPTNAF